MTQIRSEGGYTWKDWGKHFCKTWTTMASIETPHCRVVHLPEVFTSRKQMGKYGKDAVKIKITIEEIA